MNKGVPNGEWPSWVACIRIVVCAFAVFLCIRYWDSFAAAVRLLVLGLASVFMGFCIAYVINLPMRFYERILIRHGLEKSARGIALTLAILTFLGILAVLLLLVVPQFVRCMIALGSGIPAILDDVLSNEAVVSLVPEQLIAQVRGIQWDNLLQSAFEWARAGAANVFPGLASAAAGVGTFFVGCMFATWFLLEKETLSETGHRLVEAYIGPTANSKLIKMSGILDDCYSSYIKGQSCEAFILGALVSIGALLLNLPFATMIGPLVGIMSFIPMVGAYAGAIMGALMIASVSWQQALLFMVMFVVIQQFEANFIYSRVVGRMVGLSGFWTMFGLTVGAAVGGMLGAFVAVPTTAAVTRMVGASLRRREESDDDVPIEEIVGAAFGIGRNKQSS